MNKLNQKGSPRFAGEAGAIQFIVLAILLAGIAAGVWLITSGPLKLFPKAISGPISGPISPSPTPSATATSIPTPTPTSVPISAPITPTPTPILTPTPTPTTRVIKQYAIAESPAELLQLKNEDWQTYYSGIEVEHTFKDSSLGLKTIFIQFRDADRKIVQINGQDYITSYIELVPEVTPPSSGGGGTTSGGGVTSGGGTNQTPPSLPFPFSIFAPQQPEPPATDCTTSCGKNNGLNCTDQNKANTECADYYNDNSYCDFQNSGPRGDGCIPAGTQTAPANDCTTSCGINNGQNCTNQDKANTECADYYHDNSICSFTNTGDRGDGCIP